MITNKQWNHVCYQIKTILTNYDVFIDKNQVLWVDWGERSTVVCNGGPGIQISYQHRTAFSINKISLAAVEERIKIKTKPKDIIDTNLRKYLSATEI